MPSPAHNVSMVESERNFTFNFGEFVSESKSPPLYFSGLIVGVLRDVGAGGGAGETKPTEPAWMKEVLKGRMPLAWLLILAKEGSQATPRGGAE